MKKILITLALCVSMTTASVSAANFGVCTHMGQNSRYDNDSNIQAAENVKVRWIRDECLWQAMQNGSTGAFQMRAKDMDYIKKVDKAGMNQLLILAYGNTSYGVESVTVVPKQDDETYYNGYLDYVRYTVGQVKDYVDAYEIWNEPNIEVFNYNLAANGTDYAKLYLDAKAIIDELDPTATVLCGSITGASSDDTNFGKAIFDYVKTQGDVNKLIDAFSIHYYTQLDDEAYYNGLNTWEAVFDSYGYTGDVWMTENGVTAKHPDISACSEATQAAMLAKLGIQWERYLKESGRTGNSFWYDLRNDDLVSDYEANFGLVDNSYVIKPSGKAMITYNRLTGDKILDSVAKVKTKDNYFSSDEYGYLAKYINGEETTYIAYDSNNNGSSTNFTLSGDIAHVYDNLGNVTETITNPNGTKSITMSSTPVIVECAPYYSKIDNVKYSHESKTLSVNGSCNFGDTCTIELINSENEVVNSVTANVENCIFDKSFSVEIEGTYTVRVGYLELTTNLGKSSGWATATVEARENVPTLASGTVAAYNAETRTVSISGSIIFPTENQNVTLFAMPSTMTPLQYNPAAVAYVGQIEASDGNFNKSFSLPKWYGGEMAVYIGGTQVKETQKQTLSVEESEYAHISVFNAENKSNVVTAFAKARNSSNEEKKMTIIIVGYDDDMRMQFIYPEEKTVPAYTYTSIDVSASTNLPNGVTKIRTYVWDSLEGLVPLAGVVEI